MWQWIILTFIGILGLLANIMILFSVYKYKVLRKKTYTFLVSLALCDLLKVALIFNIIVYSSVKVFENSCTGTSIFGITLSCSTTFHIAAESVNRCLLVIWPYKYIRVLNKKHLTLGLSIIWIMPIAFCIATPLIWFQDNWKGDLYFHANIFGCIINDKIHTDLHKNNSSSSAAEAYIILIHIVFFAVPLVIMFICNGLILKTSYTVAQKMRRVEVLQKPKVTSPAIRKTTFQSPIIEMVSSSYATTIISENLSIKNKIEHRGNRTMSIANVSKELKRQLKMRKHEIKSSKTVLIILSVFIICNAPVFIVGWLKDKEIKMVLVKTFLTLSQLQVFIDPLVYFLRLRDFKEARKTCRVISRSIIRKTISRKYEIEK